MTLSTQTSRIEYTANGSQATFNYSFEIFQTSDMKVYKDGVLQTSGYSVTGVGNDNGGTVVFSTAPASGVVVRLARVTAKVQELVLREFQKIPVAAVEKNFDKIVAMIQELAQSDSDINVELDGLQIQLDDLLAFLQSITLQPSAQYVGETQPEFGFQGMRWYNPSTPATYVFYYDGDSGQWVQEAHEGADGALRNDLADANSEVLIGGVKAGALTKQWVMPENFSEGPFDGATDNYTAIVAAINFAVTTGSPLALGKIYATSQEIDLSSCKIVYAHNTTIVPLMDETTQGVVKYVGSQGGTLEDSKLLGSLTVVWPYADWSKARTSFFFRNCYNGEFHIGSKRASRGLYAQGWDSGTVHCDFHLKQFWQNCVGVWLGSVNSNGWCNSNRFHGGFFYGSKSVTGALYTTQAGHIYLESSPYQVNGNVFLYPSVEWVGISGPDFMLARMGGTRNKLFIGYCEYNDAATGNARPTRWILDVGLKNMIDATCVPYAIGYDPNISGVNNRIDVSGAQEPFVRGTQGYVDASGEGTQNYVNNSSTRATMALRNTGGGAALVVQGGVKTEGFAPMSGSASQTLNRFEDVSFTPSVIGSASAGTATYDRRAASVQRINNKISIAYSLKWSGHTGAGDFRVTLPIAASAALSDFNALVDCVWSGYSLGANKVLKGLVGAGSNYITLYAVSADTGALSLITLPPSGELYLTCSYQAA